MQVVPSRSKQLCLFRTKDKLLVEAEEKASKVTINFCQSTKLYYIARYFVAVYESRYGEIPIQVWNEYRNALDHFFRYLTDENVDGLEKGESKHLEKMERHLQRAVLDILKIYSHKTQDAVSRLKSEYSSDVLILVDNGSFIAGFNKGYSESENLFEMAKVFDSELGDDGHKNDAVLDRYLNTAFSFDELRRLMMDKAPDIGHAQEQYDSIHNGAHRHSIFEGLSIHVIAAIIIAVVAGLFGYGLKAVFPEGIKEYFSSENVALPTSQKNIPLRAPQNSEDQE